MRTDVKVTKALPECQKRRFPAVSAALVETGLRGLSHRLGAGDPRFESGQPDHPTSTAMRSSEPDRRGSLMRGERQTGNQINGFVTGMRPARIKTSAQIGLGSSGVAVPPLPSLAVQLKALQASMYSVP